MKYSFFVPFFTACLIILTTGYSRSPVNVLPGWSDTVATRIYNHHRYTISSKAGFFVYKSEFTTTKIPNKGITFVTRFFFSKSDSDDIIPLTIENLEKAFPANSGFRYALEQEFRNQNELTAWDPFEHMYKVQYLFLQSADHATR